MKTVSYWLLHIVIGIVGILILGLVLAAIIPVPRDQYLEVEDYGARASSDEVMGKSTSVLKARAHLCKRKALCYTCPPRSTKENAFRS